jgi:thiaminase
MGYWSWRECGGGFGVVMGYGEGMSSFHLDLYEADDQAYYEAWSFAKSHTSSMSDPTETQKALEKFIDNWTCDEFVGFVNHCREVVDGLELENDSEMSKRCEQVSRLQCEEVYHLTEQVFRRVLYLEQRFWPEVKEQ